MNKILRSSLMLLVAMLSTVGYAQTTVTFTAGTDKGAQTDAGKAGDKVTKDGITIETTDGNSAFAAAQYRFSKNSTTTFSSTVGKITKVVFTCTANGTAKYGPGCFTDPSTGNYTNKDKEGTWTGEAESFTLTASSNQVRAIKVEVTYTPNGSSPTSTVEKPTISGTTPFTDKTTVTITVPTGTTVYYTTNGTEPTDEGDEYTAPFELDKTTTVKAVAYNAKGTAKSEVVTMEFVKQGKVTTTGDGTIANPYTVADAIALSNALPADTAYYKGTIKYIKEVDTGSFGNATYSITTADSTDTLLVYRGYYLQAKKFTSKDQIKVGDEVIVRGKLINYNNTTLELGNRNYIYSLNGKTTDDAPVTGDVTVIFEEDFSEGLGQFTGKNTKVPVEDFKDIWTWQNSIKVAQADGYVRAQKDKESEAWLTSPVIDLTNYTNVTVSFSHAGNSFGVPSEECTLWAKEDGATDWTQVTINTYFTQSKSYPFVDNKSDLSSFAGKKIQLGFKYIGKPNYQGRWEIKNLKVEGVKGSTPIADKGTEANPYTPAEANEAGKALASGTKSDKAIYVKGIVCSISSVDTNRYGNARFYISEDGNTTSEQFYCFDCFNLNGAKFTNANEIAVGDEVVVTGQLQNYNGTIELARGGKIVKTNHGNKPAVEVTAANIAEFNAAENGAIVTLTLKDVQVTYSWTSSNGNTSIYLRDASGTTYIRNQKADAVQLGYKTGDVLNGTIVLTRSEYNKAIQAVINDETNASTVTVTTGNAPVATEITCTDAKNNEANLVVLRNVDIIEDNTKFYIGTGADRLQVYNGFHLDGYTVAAATDVNVKGIITRYNDTYEIQPIEDPSSTTGINGVKTVENGKDAPVYNLAGQRVSKDYKGVVIQNGKKRINK